MDLGCGALGPCDLIFPCPATLPMGFSWSVSLCQCAGETLFKRATRLERCPQVNDCDGAPIFHESPGEECEDTFGYVHVDAKTVTGSTLEVVIGHATFCGLLARPVLSCFHSVYKCIQRLGSSRGILWDTVRDELRAFQGLMVLLVAEWLPLVLASDASEWGYGVTSMSARSVIAKVGRVAERSRFRHNGGFNARAAAFQAAGDLERLAKAMGVDQQSLHEALPEGSKMWELNERFPEVPAKWRAKSLWTMLRGWPWRREDHILFLQARALCSRC